MKLVRQQHRLYCAVTIHLVIACCANAEPKIDFNRDVRPILSDKCFFCHGPDIQESDLRLDLSDRAYVAEAVVPHRPEDSKLVARITSSEADIRMPPPESNRHLTPEQIEILTQWIAEGGGYQQHWAFQPVRKLQDPEMDDPHNWIRNSIDAFVLQRLEKESLAPSHPASRERLLKRVTMDLTGLPPTIDEIEDFLSDDSPTAYDDVVDRLLASPAYGERMAVHWLDVARYADTFGFDNDVEMNMWPWRDWLIRAFNDNLSFDEFITWQLAGDLLPSPTQEHVLATAFNRLHRQNAEGGALPEEFAVEYVIDRVQTFATAFLGLTVECARCHDHKFDPISQRDFYSLYALFGNIEEAGVYADKTGAMPTPNILLYDPGAREAHEKLKKTIRRAEQELASIRLESDSGFEEWRRQFSDYRDLSPPKPLLHLTFETSEGFPGSATLVDGVVGKGIQFSGEEGFEHPEPGIARERFEPVTITFWVKPSDVTRRSILMHNSKAYWGAAGRGIECFLDHGRVEFGLSHFLPGNAVRVVSREKLPVGEWTHVAVTYDGSSRADGFRIAFNANEVPTDPLRDNLYGTILWPQDELPLVIGQRDGEVGFRGGVVDEFMVFGKALTRLEIAHLAQGLRAANNLVVDKSGVPEEHYLQRISEKYRVARERIRQARQAEHEFVESLTPIMVMRDKGAPAKAHVLVRGVYNQPGEEVGPGVPAAILPPRSDQPRNRLELARWLLRRDHPLTARVAVNRIWKMFFGRGLVATQEDFGSQGTAPSHPELLDDLAARFYESGWDMKSLCKRIVMSATYRQDSEIRSAAHAKDPANELLWRGPRYRYDAEQIRDVALASCGILTSRIGGPSVKPYQPAGLWKEVGPATFEASSGESLYRRSMYTFWKRTSPPPAMLSFDAVSREVCVARREATLTPNQALVLLNDPQFVEPARVLAATLVSQYGSDARSALTESFARLICRYPTDAEVDELCQAHAEQLDLFSSDEQAARDFIGIGEWPQGDALPPCEVAAMTSAIQLIMNFHEFQMKL